MLNGWASTGRRKKGKQNSTHRRRRGGRRGKESKHLCVLRALGGFFVPFADNCCWSSKTCFSKINRLAGCFVDNRSWSSSGRFSKISVWKSPFLWKSEPDARIIKQQTPAREFRHGAFYLAARAAFKGKNWPAPAGVFCSEWPDARASRPIGAIPASRRSGAS